jgi:Kef-type K+ transport system membrane component KefB
VSPGVQNVRSCQIAVGIVYGAPLIDILDDTWQTTFLSLGYLGLLVIVFEGGCVPPAAAENPGGLSTQLHLLVRSLPLASVIALTGIGMSLGLSFLLGPIGSYGALECFAAGASLSSTSLGTTFTVLKAVGGAGAGGLERTRLGTVLAGAAVIDDV